MSEVAGAGDVAGGDLERGRRSYPESVEERGSASGVMSRILIGYARCSTAEHDLAVQRHTLRELGFGGAP